MIRKQQLTFIFKRLRQCRNSSSNSGSNYMNNSYLNYVQAPKNKNKKEDTKQEEHGKIHNEKTKVGNKRELQVKSYNHSKENNVQKMQHTLNNNSEKLIPKDNNESLKERDVSISFENEEEEMNNNSMKMPEEMKECREENVEENQWEENLESEKKIENNTSQSDPTDNFKKEGKEKSEEWLEHEDDIPNIFEVDENLTEEEKKEKLKLIKLITEKLASPLKANMNGSNNEQKIKLSKERKEEIENTDNTLNEEDSLFADNRPIAIEVDGPSHFYANSNRYTTYTKLKHRILTKLGYNVIHISYIDWRKLRNKSEREEFILKKLKEKNDEFLDDNDRIYYNERMNKIKEDYLKYMKQKNEKAE